ncbi:uncharacterized protein [Anabrus simplex]|uniref:uncharacterized protein isoform X3 n=1 Tax=Anabrus simplex TaxID=316456 RepID=UPI0035A2CC62
MKFLSIMDETQSIKKEPSWPPDVEESSNLEAVVQLTTDKPEEIEVEPDHVFPDPSLEEDERTQDDKNETDNEEHDDITLSNETQDKTS